VVAAEPVSAETFCSRTLVDRHVELLRRYGQHDAVIAIDARDVAPVVRTVVVTAERVFDPRLYAAALAERKAVQYVDQGEPIGLAVIDPARPPHSTALIEISTLPTYSSELRRSLPVYWYRVRSTADRDEVARMLVEASGKGRQDLPAMLINAPIEKAIMRRLAQTRVTPNQITALGNVLAYGVAALLATGHFVAGAMLGMVVGVVDGLDGRQARVQVRTSPMGRAEHLLDKIYEVLWIAALAYGLSAGFRADGYWQALLVWTAAYLADTGAYDLVKWNTGRSLDEASDVDRWIRLVAGRRNIYTCVLLAGAVAGFPGGAFQAIVWWSVATACVHWLRAATVLRRAHRGVLG
jgi:phosphatidylglycerophosphate synthase